MPTRDVVFNILGRDGLTPAANRAATGVESAAARISRAGDKMTVAGRKMTHTVTLPVLALGAASIKAATDFNSSMTRIQTQAGGSARDVQYLTKQVLAMKDAQQGPNELANGLYHLKSVGMGNVQAMKALRQASDLAAVGHANLEDTVNALAGAWRTGIKGAKDFHGAVAEINAIVGSGNMQLPDLNAALGTGILPTAKTFGLTLKDVGSALALFTDEGVPADNAATRLRMTFSLLGAPTGKAQKQLASIGITQYQLANDMRKRNGLLVAVDDLRSHLDASGLSATRQAALLSRAFGGGRSSSAILSLVNNADVLGQKYAQNTKLVDQFNHAVKVQAATPAAQFHRDIADLQKTGVLIGRDLLPVVTEGARDVDKLARAFDSLSPSQKHAAIDALLVVAALGPVLTITGRLTKVLGLASGAAARAATFMSAPYRTTAEQAQVAALRAEYANAQIQADEALTAAAIARAKAQEAAVSEEAALRIAVAAEQEGAALSSLATQAGLDAIEFNAAMQSEASAAQKTALQTSAAAETMQLKLATASAGATRGVYGLQSAIGGAGIGLSVGMFTRNASGMTKTLGLLGSAAAGAALGFSMGGPMGAAIGGLAGGLSDLGTIWGTLGSAAKNAAQESAQALQSQNDAASNLLTTLKSVNGAYATQTRTATVNQLEKTGALAIASRHGLDLGKLTSMTLQGTASAWISRLFNTGKLTGDDIPKLISALDNVQIGSAGAEKAYERYQLALRNSVVPTKLLAGGSKNLAKELHGTGRELAYQKTVLGDVHGELGKVRVTVNGASATARRNTEVVRENIKWLQQQAVKAFASGESARKAAHDYREQTKALEDNLVKLGFNRRELDRLIATDGRVPKSIHTRLSSNAAELARSLDRIITKMRTIGEGATAVINITSTNTRTGYRNTVKAHAAGGMISGPGTGTSDSIAARLSNGEYVVNARQTARYRPLLDAINHGSMGYAAGGFIGAQPASGGEWHKHVHIHGGVQLGPFNYPEQDKDTAALPRAQRQLAEQLESFM